MVSPQRSSETEAGTCRWLYMISNHKRICPLLKTEPDVLRTSRGGSLEVSVLPMEKYGAFNGNMLGKSWENAGNILDRCGKPVGKPVRKMIYKWCVQPLSLFVSVLDWMILVLL